MRRIFLLTDILRCFLILFVSILSIFALKVFFDEQTQLKWTTNYKINKLSFKVAWEKACDVATADWLYNYPRGRIFPPFVWQRSKRFFRRDAGFSAPPLPTHTIKEKPICENFIRAKNHDRIMISWSDIIWLIKFRIFQTFSPKYLLESFLMFSRVFRFSKASFCALTSSFTAF